MHLRLCNHLIAKALDKNYLLLSEAPGEHPPDGRYLPPGRGPLQTFYLKKEHTQSVLRCLIGREYQADSLKMRVQSARLLSVCSEQSHLPRHIVHTSKIGMANNQPILMTFFLAIINYVVS